MQDFALEDKLLKVSSDEALQYLFMQALEDDEPVDAAHNTQHSEDARETKNTHLSTSQLALNF